MKYIVGITGGIGSGKTAVSDRFRELGVTIADADVAARDVVMPGEPALEAIRDHFGSHILQADGTLDRQALRKIVFQNKEERKWLESVTHPAIIERCQFILESAQSDYAILVLSAGSGRSPLLSRLLVIDAPEEVQVERVVIRDQNTPEQVQAIMDSQVSREKRLKYADDLILNDGTIDSLHKKVDALHAKYLELANQLT